MVFRNNFHYLRNSRRQQDKLCYEDGSSKHGLSQHGSAPESEHWTNFDKSGIKQFTLPLEYHWLHILVFCFMCVHMQGG